MTQITPMIKPINAAIPKALTTARANRGLAMFCCSRSYRGIGMASEPQELAREDALASAARKDRARKRRNQEKSETKYADHDHRLKPINHVQVFSDSSRQRRQKLVDESLENHQKSERDDRHERVLDER